MKRIGILGVGGIARAIVHGLCGGCVEDPPEIFLSPRGAHAATDLSQRYRNVRVCANNQDVLNRSQVVVIAVRPEQCAEALTGLRVADGCVGVNVMAGVGTSELRQVLDTDARLVRAMPFKPCTSVSASRSHALPTRMWTLSSTASVGRSPSRTKRYSTSSAR